MMTTPLLEVIRRAYPSARITYVAGTWSKVIPEHHPAVDTVIDCSTIGIPGRYSLSDYRKLVRTLRSQHFDLAFVLDRSPMLTLLPWLARIPRRVGPDSLGRGFSLTDRVPVSSSPAHLQHQAEMYLDLARAISLPIGSPRMRFEPTAQERQCVSQPTHLRVALFTGGGSNPGMDLTAKRWPLERYQALARKLIHELDAHILLIGGPGDVDSAHGVAVHRRVAERRHVARRLHRVAQHPPEALRQGDLLRAEPRQVAEYQVDGFADADHREKGG